MTKLRKILFLLGLPMIALAQTNSIPNTTISAAIAQPAGSTPPSQFITVASSTGINAPSNTSGTQGTMGFLDREVIRFIAQVGTTNTWQVLRGQNGTRAVGHVSGAPLLIGNPQWFHASDPLGTCAIGTEYASPWINTLTGGVWVCSGSQYVLANQSVFIPPSACWMTAATTAFPNPVILTRTGAGSQVLQGTTNTTAGTVTVNCSLADIQLGFAPSPGVMIQAVSLLYGVQTTALSSIATAIVDGITYPASTAAGAAAGATVAAIGGTLTVTPTTLQTATTTSGQCYNEKVSFGTPFYLNTDVFQPTLEQVFTTAGTSATTLQVCGVIVYFGLNPPEILPVP